MNVIAKDLMKQLVLCVTLLFIVVVHFYLSQSAVDVFYINFIEEILFYSILYPYKQLSAGRFLVHHQVDN